MTSKISLLHEMAEHMEYMQTCLKECHQLDEWDDYHWFRRSEELLARAVDAYATQLVKGQALAYGLPFAVQRIAENILEALPADKAEAFFVALPDAVGCDGKDLSRVHWQFLAAELRSLPPQPDGIQAVIDPVIAGMDLLAQGLHWPTAAHDAARAAAHDVARAAGWDAAEAAAWAAAEAAAEDAARAAAAWAAAEDAAWAAADAARAAARLRQRDLLLQLIADAPVVEGLA